jgi:chromosome segregation ATPase
MTPTPRTKFLLALLATGLLAAGAVATSVAAKPGDAQNTSPRPQDRPKGSQNATADQEARYHEMCDHPANATVEKRCEAYRNAQERKDIKDDRKQVKEDRRNLTQDRKELREDRKELRDDVKDSCRQAAANSTAKARCDHLQDAVKARRVAHALLEAIRVHERELGRVDFRIEMAKERIASGNLTANQTREAQARLAHLEERHDRLVEKLKEEQAKLAALRDRWSEVKDHLKDREQAGEDNGGVAADEQGTANDQDDGSVDTGAAA